MDHAIEASTSKLIDFPEVQSRTGNASYTTYWRMWRAGRFPKPIAISRSRNLWPESEINEWIADRIADRAA